ncbi:GNAT family N-acetyltransferase [Amycolatopsis antarctica]|uniref:GNAT family N-acetyltransferase n=1 Tax=Amycolatopsis antarctica TaxID=1854586 RepID=A0A263D7F7_9PSEU|nr:GNAT family N-acetyltransferase [Amycolatopsis antarctica]OZM73507.1 GNAT family N-acetyltransferase [Amycolatopsis antarctica]
MTDRYPLRRLNGPEFEAWARMTAGVYGQDWREDGLRDARFTLELDRTLVAFDEGAPIAGAAILTRSMTVPGTVLPVAGVTLVAVAPTHRRRGLLRSMMREQLTGLHESAAEPVAALNASEAGIYGRFGYGVASYLARCRGEQRSMVFRDDVDRGPGRIRLLDRDEARTAIEKVYESVRPNAVGMLDRPARFWDARLHDAEHVRHGATALRFAVHEEPDGIPTGYALYRLRPCWENGRDLSEVVVIESAAETPRAYAAVWGFLVEIDGHFRISFDGAVDEPLPHLLLDSRGLDSTVVDNLWVRLVDVDRALVSRRYAGPVDVVLEVTDDFCPWNAGRFRLRSDGGEATCERTRATADLRLSVAELGAVFLGGTSMATLAAAGRVAELRAGAVAEATSAFRGVRAPFHPSGAAFPAF